MINEIEIDAHLFSEVNEQNKLGRFRQRVSPKKVTRNGYFTRNGDLVYHIKKR